MRRHTISFKHAFDGVVYVFRTQPNFRVHAVFTVLVLVASWYLQVTRIEFLLLLLAIMLVLVTEMLNTANEALTDLITTKRHPYAKISKDVSAGMVLLSAIVASVIGLVVFVPYLLNNFN